MILPQPDIEYLNEHAMRYSVSTEANMTCVLIQGYQLPDGYSPVQSDLLLRLNPGYPDVQPDMWWFNPPVRLSDGRAGGLIRCAHCGNLITGEQVTKPATGKKYVYYRCSMYRLAVGHPQHRVTEAQLDEQILAAFATMKQDEETADWFSEVLRARTKDEQRDSRDEAKELQRQMTLLRQQQDELLNLRLMKEIDQDAFARKSTELRDRIATLAMQLESVDTTRGEQAEAAIKVFELSQNLSGRWLAADYATKRQILDIVFSNFRLDGVTLCYEMRKPFALLAEGLLVSSNRGDKI